MKKYSAKFIYVFTPIQKTIKAHGNPALVVFGDPPEKEKRLISMQSRVPLNGEMIELPIVSFVEPISNKKNEFNIKYRFFNGMPINVCGHGTVAAAKAIVDKYNIKEETKLTFHLDQSFEENREFPTLIIKTNGTSFTVEFDDVSMKKIDSNHPVSKIIAKNIKSTIVSQIYETGLNDYIFVSSDAAELRKVIIPKKDLDKIREINSNYRAIMAVAKSDKEGYDYETTVYSDGLPGPTYKDPACGSANKEIPKLIKKSNILSEKFEKDIAQFEMYYPFRYEELGIMGGVQTINYHHKKGKVFVTGGAKKGEEIQIEINGDSIEFNNI